LRSTYRSTAR